MRSQKPILLVEDDRVDSMTVKRAFKSIHLSNRLDCVTNGEEALAYLQDTANELPCIILLDLNMPRMNGLELLKIIKHDPNYQTIPVIILTTSEEEQDRLESFRAGVAGYMVKPVDYLKFVEVVKTINLYWTISELPN